MKNFLGGLTTRLEEPYGDPTLQRSTLIPLAKTKDGKIVPALPTALNDPIGGAIGLFNSLRSGQEPSPKDAINALGGLMGGGIARNPKQAFRPNQGGNVNAFGGRVGLQNLVDAGVVDSRYLGVYDTLQEALNRGVKVTPELRDGIWNRWGFEVGAADRKVRFEIDPTLTEVDASKLPRSTADIKMLDEVVTNPVYQKAYPELFTKGEVRLSKGEDFLGSMESWKKRLTLDDSLRSNPTKLRSVVEHELNHYPEKQEGFAQGGNTEIVLGPKLPKRLEELGFQQRVRARALWNDVKRYLNAPEIRALELAHTFGSRLDVEDLIRGIQNDPTSFPNLMLTNKIDPKRLKNFNHGDLLAKKAESLAIEEYNHIAGEQWSNLAQHRQTMGRGARRSVAPSAMLDNEDFMRHRPSRQFANQSKHTVSTKWPIEDTEKTQARIAERLREFAKNPHKK